MVCLSARLHLISIEVLLVGPSQDCLPTQVLLTHDPLFFHLFHLFQHVDTWYPSMQGLLL